MLSGIGLLAIAEPLADFFKLHPPIYVGTHAFSEHQQEIAFGHTIGLVSHSAVILHLRSQNYRIGYA